jgi:hypothetical protein
VFLERPPLARLEVRAFLGSGTWKKKHNGAQVQKLLLLRKLSHRL